MQLLLSQIGRHRILQKSMLQTYFSYLRDQRVVLVPMMWVSTLVPATTKITITQKQKSLWRQMFWLRLCKSWAGKFKNRKQTKTKEKDRVWVKERLGGKNVSFLRNSDQNIWRQSDFLKWFSGCRYKCWDPHHRNGDDAVIMQVWKLRL